MVDTVILIFLVVAALWTVMTRSLLRSAIGLALVSILLTIAMFRLHAPLAAVFELSVCAGLISVLFVSMISLTQPLTQDEVLQHMRERRARFWFLPLLVIILAGAMGFLKLKTGIPVLAAEKVNDVRQVLWHSRQIDILGQIIVLMVGVFGVLIFFKERFKK